MISAALHRAAVVLEQAYQQAECCPWIPGQHGGLKGVEDVRKALAYVRAALMARVVRRCLCQRANALFERCDGLTLVVRENERAHVLADGAVVMRERDDERRE